MSKKALDVVISKSSQEPFFDIEELWRFRELFLIFIWRDVKVRYRQTVLGILWVLLQPILTTFIFTILFGTLAKISSGNLPYALFVLIGLVYWLFFSSSLTDAIEAIIAHQSIIKKIYFPTVILIFSSICTRCVDFLISLFLLLLASFFLGFPPTPWAFLIIPLGMGITMIAASGIGCALAAVNVKYRDVRYVTPFVIQSLFYVTPVVYPLSMVGEEKRLWLLLNPMAGIIEAVRWSFVPQGNVPWVALFVSFVIAMLCLLGGLWYFRRTRRFFADIV